MEIRPRLPVVGEEYWEREAQVRFYHLAKYADDSDGEVEAEVWLEGWTGSLIGLLNWKSVESFSGTKQPHLHIGETNVDTYRTKCFYLRARHIEGADRREAVLPGDSLRIKALESGDIDQLAPHNWRESRRERVLRSIYLILSKG
jgi:hypothetical protein